MPLRATTLRIGDDLWELMEREARQQGISVAQFLRDSALLRIGQLAALRGDRGTTLTVEELAQRSLSRRRRRRREDGAPQALSAPGRLEALQRTGLLDADVDPALDRLVGLTAKILGVPVVLVTLVDAARQFFAAQRGLAEPWGSRRETDLERSFCQEVVITRRPLVVDDAREHPRLSGHRAIDDLGVVAYAGMPLRAAGDEVIGSFCAIDRRPHAWTAPELEILEGLADSAAAHVATRTPAAAS